MNVFRVLPAVLALLLALGIPARAQGDPACPGAPLPRLTIGAQARVLPGDANTLRDAPTRSANRVGAIPGGAVFSVLAGPTCADGFNWWQADYAGLVGWTVEGQGDTYWVEPYEPNVPTATPAPLTDFAPPIPVANVLAPGVQARVISDDPLMADTRLVVRSDPARGAGVVASLDAGAVVTITGGPVESDNLRWWQVETGSATGWAIEGLVNPETSAYERTLLAACPLTGMLYAAVLPRTLDERYLYSTDLNGGYCIYDRLRLPGVHTYYSYFAYLPNTILWTPDRRWMTFIDFHEVAPPSRQDLYLVSADGLTRRRVTQAGDVWWADWSPDGARLLMAQSQAGSARTAARSVR